MTDNELINKVAKAAAFFMALGAVSFIVAIIYGLIWAFNHLSIKIN